MPFRVRCSNCQAMLALPDSAAGKSVRCPRCQNTFQVAAAKPPVEVQEVEVVEEPPRSNAIRPRPAVAREFGEPRPEPSRRPKRGTKRQGKLSASRITPVVLLAVAGLLLAVAAVGVWWAFRSDKANSDPIAQTSDRPSQLPKEELKAGSSSPARENEAPKPETKQQSERVEPPVQPNPTPPGQPVLNGSDAKLPASTLAALKAATVFVKVQMGRLEMTGSGFLLKVDGKTGYVVTNDHVVSAPPRLRILPRVSLVFWSGTKQEKTIPAQVLATDPDRDLAVLKVTDLPEFPAPLNLEQKVALTETMTVWILGFPFGEMLSARRGNPALTIGKGTVSSIRNDERDEMKIVQIDGDINPGNSGGPVVDGAGHLVGISVAKVVGTRIGLAIPPAELTKMLNGRVGAVAFRTIASDAGSAELEVQAKLIDPLNRIKMVGIHYVPAEGVNPSLQRGADGLFPPLPGGQRLNLAIAGQKAQLRFKVAAAPNTAFLFQAVYTNGEGKTIYTSPSRFQPRAGQPAEGAALPPRDVAFAVDPKLTGAWSNVYLSDMQEFDFKKGPWDFGKGHVGNPTKDAIVVKGTKSPHGLGMHPEASIKYKLGKQAKVFKAGIAFQDRPRGEGGPMPTIFMVLGDGKVLWRSQPLRTRGVLEDCAVDVSGVDLLELRTMNAGADGYGSHAVWVEPHVLREGKVVLPEPPPVAITPPAGDKEKVTLSLPAPLADVAVGGGGRYLILHLPKFRKLAVFDANEAKIVKYLAVAEDRIYFAAGMAKLVVALPESKVLQRWNLATFEREKTIPTPVSEDVKQVLLGSASSGPLVLNTTFYDLESLKALPIDTTKAQIPYGDGDRVRVSADGKVFGRWVPNTSPQQNQTLVLEGSRLVLYGFDDSSVGHTNPGPDGKVIFTGRGLFTTRGKAIGTVGHPNGEYCLPAHHGEYYLKLSPKYKLAVMRVGDDRPIVSELAGIDLIEGIDAWDREDFTTDKRIHFMPDAKLIITIPATNDRLALHHFDPDAALEKSGLEYLFVTSRPVLAAKKGAVYTYRVAVKSKKGGVKYSLDSGPPDMKLSAAGELNWQVPADFADKECVVIIRITDASGNETFHTFTLTIND